MAAQLTDWFRDLPEDLFEPEPKKPLPPHQPNIKRSTETEHPEVIHLPNHFNVFFTYRNHYFQDCPTKRRPGNASFSIDNAEGKAQMRAETPRARQNENHNAVVSYPCERMNYR